MRKMGVNLVFILINNRFKESESDPDEYEVIEINALLQVD
jgi:hypothetical protein